jgi:hypothetical protein
MGLNERLPCNGFTVPPWMAGEAVPDAVTGALVHSSLRELDDICARAPESPVGVTAEMRVRLDPTW